MKAKGENLAKKRTEGIAIDIAIDSSSFTVQLSSARARGR
jgi:hypothetical protein